jgi:hypothetical protein
MTTSRKTRSEVCHEEGILMISGNVPFSFFQCLRQRTGYTFFAQIPFLISCVHIIRFLNIKTKKLHNILCVLFILVAFKFHIVGFAKLEHIIRSSSPCASDKQKHQIHRVQRPVSKEGNKCRRSLEFS